MKRSLLLLLLFPVLGCYRDYGPTQPVHVMCEAQRTILSDFAGSTETVVDCHGLWIRGHFDFSLYDSLVITFNAAPIPGSAAEIPLAVKVGPAFYAYGTLTGDARAQEYHVRTALLAKPKYASLAFLVRDTQSGVLLSDLLVVGYYTY